eukprot:scaffold1346_cov354-Pavlova_lutheri.AAC.3
MLVDKQGGGPLVDCVVEAIGQPIANSVSPMEEYNLATSNHDTTHASFKLRIFHTTCTIRIFDVSIEGLRGAFYSMFPNMCLNSFNVQANALTSLFEGLLLLDVAV